MVPFVFDESVSRSVRSKSMGASDGLTLVGESTWAARRTACDVRGNPQARLEGVEPWGRLDASDRGGPGCAHRGSVARHLGGGQGGI